MYHSLETQGRSSDFFHFNLFFITINDAHMVTEFCILFYNTSRTSIRKVPAMVSIPFQKYISYRYRYIVVMYLLKRLIPKYRTKLITKIVDIGLILIKCYVCVNEKDVH